MSIRKGLPGIQEHLDDDSEERGFLGALLAHPDETIALLGLNTDPALFTSRPCQLMFEAACALRERGAPWTFITWTDELRVKGELENAGGADQVSAISTKFETTPGNAAIYLDRMRHKAAMKLLAEDAQFLAKDAETWGTDPSEAIAASEQRRERIRALQSPVLEGATAVPVDDFPEPPQDAAFHGAVGEIVKKLAPETEAPSVAVLLHLLSAAGSIAGHSVWTVAGGVRHHCNLFAVVVGETSRARKGTAWAAVQPVVGSEQFPGGLDPSWRQRRVKSGLSSGEGLKWFVRDPIIKPGEEQPTDPGETDKRLFVIEEEFASVLHMGRREGNTLSSVLRQAWDGKRLDTLTKNDPVTATGAHVAIVGHITREELRSLLSKSDAFNGFSNRFLWLASRRAQLLPEGGRLERVNLLPVLDRLKGAMSARRGELRRDAAAGEMWREFYERTAKSHVPGTLGAVTNRGEAQVLRLSCLYALLDGAPAIGVPHLAAALALWDYCERSARWIFGTATGNADADAIFAAVARKGVAGMTQTEISREVFQGNRKAQQIADALNVLKTAGMIHSLENRETGGAPATRWSVVKATNLTNQTN